jgi:hypothetical protein
MSDKYSSLINTDLGRHKQKYVNEYNMIGTLSFTITDGTKLKADLVKSLNINGAFNIIPCYLVLSPVYRLACYFQYVPQKPLMHVLLLGRGNKIYSRSFKF